MRLQTPVIYEKCRTGISYADRIMMLGSCFSDNIGRQMADFGFDVMVNPFGTLYNPASIHGSITRLAEGIPFSEKDCTDMGAGSGLICSFHHHTSFAKGDRTEFIRNANEALMKAHEHFKGCTKIIITLGTSWCFRHKESGLIVSNCLKRPAAEFERVRMSVKEVKDALTGIMDICKSHEGKDGFMAKEFIFTVSPIRHFKDGAHGNQISKASLLLGIEETISEGRDNMVADYFPAYEIMMDELRDYRFYAEDMCHPTMQAVNYIREQFLDWCLVEKDKPLLEENIRLHKQNCHIPKH